MVTVRVSIPDLDSVSTPASGITVTALPFDRDSLAHALEAAHHATRPYQAELDSASDAFRQPFLDYFRASQRRNAVADSVKAGQLPAPALTAAEQRMAQAKAALQHARDSLGDRIDSLRGIVAQWEDSTYADYDSVAKAILAGVGRQPVSDTTDNSGQATLRLRPSPAGWWVSASSWDPLDPNRVWYWNVKVEGDSIDLSSANGHRRTR